MPIPAIIVHGGAGRRSPDRTRERSGGCANAVEAGWQVLTTAGTAVDAVVAAVALLESHPVFNAGIGSCLTAAGTVEMDASIMDGGRLVGGGVGAVSTVVNPVRLAQTVMDDGRHVLLVGAGAETFARTRDLPMAPPESFVTERQRRRWLAGGGGEVSTVGAVAVDAAGHVAAATSTGGLMGKLPGRVGDSAIIGAGTYADDRAGAASATGQGEAIILTGLAKFAVDLLRDGSDPGWVARHVIRDLSRRVGKEAGIILIDRFGRIGHACNSERMMVGLRTAAVATTVRDE